VSWWLLEQLVRDGVKERAAPIASIIRVLAGLGPGDPAESDALAETELRGLLMHGQPPRTDDEWRRAAATFTPEAIAEFERWAAIRGANGSERSEDIPASPVPGGSDRHQFSETPLTNLSHSASGTLEL
jgi:hypothetical protein